MDDTHISQSDSSELKPANVDKAKQPWWLSADEACVNHSNYPFRRYSRAVDTGRQINLPLLLKLHEFLTRNATYTAVHNALVVEKSG